MNFVDWFSGIGGFRVALESAGHKCVWSCEIEKFPRQVQEARYEHEPEAGDITAVDAAHIPDADLWAGGFPCQDLSVAGRRAGIGGKRSGLVWTLLELAKVKRPTWLLLENVPGLLSGHDEDDPEEELAPDDGPSSVPPDEGRTPGDGAEDDVRESWFGTLLGAVAEQWPAVGWRVLDAQNFGVPQRRRRVFIVGGPGTEAVEKVLFELEGRAGNHPPGFAQGEGSSGSAGRGAPAAGGDVAYAIQRRERGLNDRGDGTENLIVPAADPDGGSEDPAPTVTSKWSKGAGGPSGSECQHLVATPKGEWPAQVAPTLDADYGKSYGQNHQHSKGGLFVPTEPVTLTGDKVYPTLDATNDKKGFCNQAVDGGYGVIVPAPEPTCYHRNADCKVTDQEGKAAALKAEGEHSYQILAVPEAPANPVTASAGHHGHSSPRGDGADNLVIALSDDSTPKASDQASTLRAKHGRYGGGEQFVAIPEEPKDPYDWMNDSPVPIHADATRPGGGTAKTPSEDAEGAVRLRDPGLGVGNPGDPAFTVMAAAPHSVAVPNDAIAFDAHNKPKGETGTLVGGGGGRNDVNSPLVAYPEIEGVDMMGGKGNANPFKGNSPSITADGANSHAIAVPVEGDGKSSPPLLASGSGLDRVSQRDSSNILALGEVTEPAVIEESGDAVVRAGKIAGPLTTGGGKPGQGYQAIVTNPPPPGDSPAIGFGGRDNGQDAKEDVAPTIRSMADEKYGRSSGWSAAVAFQPKFFNREQAGGSPDAVSSPLTAKTNGGDSVPHVAATPAPARPMVVRRLTPSECERLQGFPDGWTCLCGTKPDCPDRRVPPWVDATKYKSGGCGHSACGCKCPDAKRYKALGNAIAVPVVRWIGGRMEG